MWRDVHEQAFHSVLDGATESAARGLEHVRVIRFDRSGRLWIGARDGGLAVFDPVRGKLTRWRHKAAEPGSLG